MTAPRIMMMSIITHSGMESPESSTTGGIYIIVFRTSSVMTEG